MLGQDRRPLRLRLLRSVADGHSGCVQDSPMLCLTLQVALALPVSLAPGSRVGVYLSILPSYTGQANKELIMTEAAAVVPT